jgi:hypothetical protein
VLNHWCVSAHEWHLASPRLASPRLASPRLASPRLAERRKAKGERRKAKGERRKAKGERRKAKGERRKAKGERRKAKGERRKAKGDKKGTSPLGIRELYFNGDYPENNIVKAKYPHSGKAEYFNGEYWCVSKRGEIAEKLLNGLVESVKKRFKELPLDDNELDGMYDRITEYISDSTIFPKLSGLVSQHMINHSRRLSKLQKT